MLFWYSLVKYFASCLWQDALHFQFFLWIAEGKETSVHLQQGKNDDFDGLVVKPLT